MQRLQVHQDGRFLQTEDGRPFFWLGDTAWELFHKLNREEAAFYLETRAKQGFNVIQAVALAEMLGLTTPNAYGRFPLLKNGCGEYDPGLPDTAGEYSYWDHVDFIVDKATEYGLYIAFLPTWGDKFHKLWGQEMEIFTKANAGIYGEWLGKRYRGRNNIVWVLGGDRPLATRKHFDIIEALAYGLRSGDGGKHLITFHPCGQRTSSQHLHEESWLDFNMIQSGHARHNFANYQMVEADYQLTPVKPVVDAEPCYEDHPVDFKEDNGFFEQTEVRKAAYRAVFAGAFGHTYGNHNIWGMNTEYSSKFILHWKDALVRPGAQQMRHMKDVIEKYMGFDRIPDQSLLAENYSGFNHQRAMRGKDCIMIYTPHSTTIHAGLGTMDADRVSAAWFDPRTGEETPIGVFRNAGTETFVAPEHGHEMDYVLILKSER